jgi:RimJ/RimL family protein N-acetyltransferase
VVRLRAATLADAAQLYRWRVDAETVRQSIAPPPASVDEHRGWLERQLRDPRVALYVAHDEERRADVGAVRIDRRSDDEAEISITVDPAHRGRGYSHELIACGVHAAGVPRIVARVKPDNLRSLRAFRALGFAGDDAGGGDLIQLVHEPTHVNRGAGT